LFRAWVHDIDSRVTSKKYLITQKEWDG